MTFQNKRLTAILVSVAVLLIIPFIAMQCTNEIKWSSVDFITAAVLLGGTGLLCEVVLRKVHKTSYRIAFCSVLLIVLLLVWIELAIGIFGTVFAGS